MPAKWQQWMPFHIDRFMGSRSVAAMHPAARIGYLYLLAAQWQSEDCSIPAEDNDLSIESGLGELWEAHKVSILRKFSTREDGRLVNAVVAEEWAAAKTVYEKRWGAAIKTNQAKSKAKKTPTVRTPRAKRTVTPRLAFGDRDTGTGTGTGTETGTEEQKPKATPLSDKSDATRPEEFANSWNRLRGTLPKVMEFTDSRRKKVQVRQSQGISLEAFEKAVSKCASIPFLSGDNKQGWKADFDWLLENDKNLLKVLEGKYEAGKPDTDETLGELIRQRRETSRMAGGDAFDGMGIPQA